MYNKRLAKRCTDLGLKKTIIDGEESDGSSFTCKDFRSKHATWCAAKGMDTKTLHIQMGHKSEVTTLRYYAAPTDETVDNEVEKMEGLFAVSS